MPRNENAPPWSGGAPRRFSFQAAGAIADPARGRLDIEMMGDRREPAVIGAEYTSAPGQREMNAVPPRRRDPR